MTNDQAKEILLRYRPETAEAGDTELAEALALCARDSALQTWFEAHCRTQGVIRQCFQQLAPPAGLKEQIISEHHAALCAAWWRRPVALATAATIMFVAAVAAFWLQRGEVRSDDRSFAAYRTRMVKEASKLYTMEFETNELAEIRRYLSKQEFPADFSLPGPLGRAVVTGCVTTRWQTAKVSMICFRKNGSNSPAAKSDLWLFVMDQAAVKDAPSPGERRVETISRLATAAWTTGGRIYLLGTEGGEAAVRKWL